MEGQINSTVWFLTYDSGLYCQLRLNRGAKRLHYSMFDVGRSMFDVMALKCALHQDIRVMESKPPDNPTTQPVPSDQITYLKINGIDVKQRSCLALYMPIF